VTRVAKLDAMTGVSSWFSLAPTHGGMMGGLSLSFQAPDLRSHRPPAGSTIAPMRQPSPSLVRTTLKIVEQEHAAPGVPRLQFKGVARAVTWELCYGGLAIATGRLAPEQDDAFADVASIEPVMDSAGLTIMARYEDGEPCAIEVPCVRPVRPTTRAEATARARWPGTRDQSDAPELTGRFMTQTREIGSPISGQHRRACIYQHVSVLLQDRRLQLRAPRRAPVASRDRTG
jgi:hypothetical protein